MDFTQTSTSEASRLFTPTIDKKSLQLQKNRTWEDATQTRAIEEKRSLARKLPDHEAVQIFREEVDINPDIGEIVFDSDDDSENKENKAKNKGTAEKSQTNKKSKEPQSEKKKRKKRKNNPK